MLSKEELGIPLHLTTIQMVDTFCYTKDGHGVFRVTDKKMCESVILAANQHHALVEALQALESWAEVVLQNAKCCKMEKLVELQTSDWNGVGFLMRVQGEFLEAQLLAKEVMKAKALLAPDKPQEAGNG